jgi:hypothetical protein
MRGYTAFDRTITGELRGESALDPVNGISGEGNISVPGTRFQRDPPPSELRLIREGRLEHVTDEGAGPYPAPLLPLLGPDLVGRPEIHQTTDAIIETAGAYQYLRLVLR